MASSNPSRDGEVAARRADGVGSRSLRRPEVYEAEKARRAMSLPEVLLWQRLKGSPQGVAFRKQHSIGLYRADFYCAAARLVIEVDGMSHDMGDRPERDTKRTATLEAQGYTVVRIAASEVLRDADGAAEAIVVLALAAPSGAARHLPARGEDFR